MLRRPIRRRRAAARSRPRARSRIPTSPPRRCCSIPAKSKNHRRIVANAERTDSIKMFGNVLSYLVSIATILGIPMALYGYYSSQQAARVDRTFDFYKEFRTGEMQADLNLLVDKFNERAEEIQKLVEKGGNPGPVEDSLLQDASAKAALSTVVVFYDAMGSCVDHGVCDGN